jgi:SAM-dependent methyltransferase
MAGANSVLNGKSAMSSHMSAHVAADDATIHRGSSEYYSLQRSIFEAGSPFVTPRSRVVDLSCTDGSWLSPFVERFEDLCHFIGVTNVDEDAYACMDRFRIRVRLGIVEIASLDLQERFPDISSRLTIAVNKLGQLEPHRQDEVLGKVRRFLERGGAFILVEKVSSAAEAETWENTLRAAGFREPTRFWSKNGFVAWITTK